jgi:hypothetical protein
MGEVRVLLADDHAGFEKAFALCLSGHLEFA